ncbi:unnamed protein product [Oikopleura dioica]|uniref:Uncharacterized protein n=1 Tax=Oikopleura dioica TaxID=34765 RepID=E4XEM3_OIKDI|nr:unnamed protein product [Oikopleura dioica]CBY31132.1 unnamed protein product [Oikopleura dioica]
MGDNLSNTHQNACNLILAGVVAGFAYLYYKKNMAKKTE